MKPIQAMQNLIASMRDCLNEREAFIKSLINEIVEKNLEIERLNRFINRIVNLVTDDLRKDEVQR